MGVIEVEARVLGRRTANLERHQIEIPEADGGAMSLRRLIELVVRSEVVAFQARAQENTFVRVLTQKQIDHAVTTGRVSLGGAEAMAVVDVEAAIEAALTAQRDGIYQVVLDDQPVDRLDEIVPLRSGSHLLFVRLVALAGG